MSSANVYHLQDDPNQFTAIDANLGVIRKATSNNTSWTICGPDNFSPDVPTVGYKYPWFDPRTLREGGFFVQVSKHDYDNDKKRPAVPNPKIRQQYGIDFKTKKGQLLNPIDNSIQFGYYVWAKKM